MGYTEEELLAFIARNDEHKAYYESQLAELRGREVGIDLSAIKARVNAATEGPWEAKQRYGLKYVPRVLVSTLRKVPRLRGVGYDGAGDYAISQHPVVEFVGGDDDAEFIAAARQDVPALIAEVERLRTQIERVRGLHTRKHAVFSWSHGLRYLDPCPDCDGKAGVHECGCWADADIVYVCWECDQRARPKGGPALWPCRTIEALEGDGE